ncbi:MAG: NFACT family protein [Atopostipes suicloacalis]|nr:NFACT family protein [Atopostipes suicloacalis]MDN6730611.1 NFACT family protein [Atopostipes suicloacalis]
MSYDGLFTHAIVEDLKEKILSGRVSKIHQPFPNELTLRIRSNRKNYQLLLSAHPQYARVQLTNLKFDNPQQAPQYCMVLRKYIEGSILVDIIQRENDRVIEFVFTGRDELGDEQKFYLIAEIMGRHSNILLVNKEENELVEAIRHVPATLNSYRTIMPGADYRPAPPQDSMNPFDYRGKVKITGENIKEKIGSIQAQFQGFGRDSARELLYQIDEHPKADPGVVFDKFLAPYAKNQLNPTLTLNKARSFFTAYDYKSIIGEKEYFESLTELLDEYYENKAERDRVHQQSNDLSQLLKNERKKNRNKQKKLKREIKEAEKAEEYRVKGEVLTAYMHQVEQGMDQIELENFYDGNKTIQIELDPKESPAENAQRYFKNYQRLKSRKKHLAKQIPLTRQEIEYIDSLLAQLEIASSDDLEDIRDELRDQGYLTKQRKDKKRKRKKSKPEKYYSSDGDLIFVGKNNKQNDQLTMRTANKSDYWLHTKDIPGSHVIIRNSNPTDQTLEEAAILSAYFSKYRMSSSVPVDYTQVKHVHKPNGAKPGYVIYDNQQTIFVTPSAKKVKSLKTKN